MDVTGRGQAPPASPASLPGLFTDLLHDFGSVERFYGFPPSLDATQSAARLVRMDSGHRRRLVDELARQNPQSGARESLDRLALDGTVAVVAGQQVGLLGGPVFTLYKALTAVRCADELTARGVPAVPVFWLATEDHDLDEVNHAWLWHQERGPRRIEAATTGVEGAPVGRISIEDAGLGELSWNCIEGPFSDVAADLGRGNYSPPTDFGRSFRGLYGSLLGSTGLLFLCPLADAVRELAVPVLRDAVLRMPELSAALLRRGGLLRSAGYHEQVRFNGSSSLLMLFEEDRRVALRRNSSSFVAPNRSYSAKELIARMEAAPSDVSPSALLRPVVQDYLLPTAALVTGPSEASYLAQSAVLYEGLIARMPTVLPRASFTVVDGVSRRLTAKYGLDAADCFRPRNALETAISARIVPPEVRSILENHKALVESSLSSIEAAIRRFDPTLAEGFRTSRRKIRYQIDKTKAKVARESLRRNSAAGRHASRLMRWMHPTGHSQERIYCTLSLIGRFGLDLPDAAYRAIEPGCGDHAFLNL